MLAELHGEAILLHADSGLYYSLNAVGLAVWKCAAAAREEHTVAHLIGVIVAEFEVEREVAQRDVEAFLVDLEKRKFVIFLPPQS
ncbi:MAG: PqqD family protein [Polyangiaceae bacterium]